MLQLPLSVTLRVDATFANFYTSSDNQWLVEAVQHLCRQEYECYGYLWGASGSGVSHLLQAVQHLLPDMSIQYLPLTDILGDEFHYAAEEVLAGLETLDMVVIDDIQCMAGNAEWEVAVFHLFNRLRDAGKKLLVGAHQSSKHLSIELPDLHSRLQWGDSYQLQPLNDEEKQHVLLTRAHSLGLVVKEDAVQFMLNHCGRNLSHLMSLLNTLDDACLIEKRAITIPFIKSVLNI